MRKYDWKTKEVNGKIDEIKGNKRMKGENKGNKRNT